MPQKPKIICSGDSRSLWNITLSPGWTNEESDVLRLAIMKFGFGRWKEIVDSNCLPSKTPGQLNMQSQRLVGQQSTGEFTGIRLDTREIFKRNSEKTDVVRKNGCIINSGANPTKEERQKKIAMNRENFEISQEESDKIVLPTSNRVPRDRDEDLEHLESLKEHLKKLKNALKARNEEREKKENELMKLRDEISKNESQEKREKEKRENGVKENGERKNGGRENGVKENRVRENGERKNGGRENGVKENGVRENGERKNGERENGTRERRERVKRTDNALNELKERSERLKRTERTDDILDDIPTGPVLRSKRPRIED